MSMSRKEREELKKQEAAPEHRQEHEEHLRTAEAQKTASRKKWIVIGCCASLLLLAGIGMLILSYLSPSQHDDFAKCLTEKGAVMYGAMGWCEFTQGQKAMFGNSFKYINYKEFSEFPTEQYGEIKKTPTWIISGKAYPTVQTFDRLAELTGCSA